MSSTKTLITPVETLGHSTDSRPCTPTTNVAIRARFDFAAAMGMQPIKSRLLQAGHVAMASCGGTNGILLFGLAGNGKTFFAEALADELGLPIISMNLGTAANRFVNQTTQQAMAVFYGAVAQALRVLFIDAAEALLANHASMTDHAGEYSRTTAAMFTRLVDMRGKGVVLIAAINYLDRLDPAAIRDGRFDTKIEVTAPDDAARQALIRHTVTRAVDHFVWPSAKTLASLSKHWAGFSVSRIRAVARRVGRRAREGCGEDVSNAAFQAALREVQGTFGDFVPAESQGL